jgi:hypothetical protein
MGKVYTELDSALGSWLQAQPMFFVATAPAAVTGHVNCSPKGGDCFRVLAAHSVAYLDRTGSGVETIAHVQENGRIVLMFCAFSGPPKIVRLHGRGEALYPGTAPYEELLPRFAQTAGTRAIIRVALSRVSDSCGFGVPKMDFVSHRDAMDVWAKKKGPEGVVAYRRMKNGASIDGIPGFVEL